MVGAAGAGVVLALRGSILVAGVVAMALTAGARALGCGRCAARSSVV